MDQVFSPSSTVTFAQCPRKWALHRAGWKPRVIAYPELCAVLGDGFSVAMNAWNHGLITGQPIAPDGAYQIGLHAMGDRLEADQLAGRRIAEKDTRTVDLLPAYLSDAIGLYLKADPLKGWTLLQSEQTYPDHGKARLDLLASDADGLAVFDYKVKVKLDERWEAKTIEEYAHSQQRFHYQWMTGAKRFYIILVVLGPKPYVKRCPYGESKYFTSGDWLFSSQVTWGRMARERDAHPTLQEGAPTHHDQYGSCEYHEACLDNGLDPALMNVNYVQIERKPAIV